VRRRGCQLPQAVSGSCFSGLDFPDESRIPLGEATLGQMDESLPLGLDTQGLDLAPPILLSNESMDVCEAEQPM